MRTVVVYELIHKMRVKKICEHQLLSILTHHGASLRFGSLSEVKAQKVAQEAQFDEVGSADEEICESFCP